MLSRQFTLLREVQSFRLLALATLGSAVGTWLAFVALTIDVYDRTNSAVWVSALLIADFLPENTRSTLDHADGIAWNSVRAARSRRQDVRVPLPSHRRAINQATCGRFPVAYGQWEC